MAGPIRNFKRIILKISFIIFFLAIFLVLYFLKKNSEICEFYTRKIGRPIQNCIGRATSVVPFSVTELVAVIFIVLCLFFLVSAIIKLFKLKIFKAINRLLNIVLLASIAISAYFVTAELAYNREALPISFYEEEVNKGDIKTVATYFINDLNDVTKQMNFTESGEIELPYTFDKLSEICMNEYEEVKGNEYFTDYTVKPKKMASSPLYREFHITGLTFMPFGEANINTLNLNAGIPYTILHELAHSKGVMREDDANQLALALSLTSEYPLLRFSAYYETFSSFIYCARLALSSEEYNSLINRIDPKFISYLDYSNEYWDSHDLLTKFANWWNDLYLKGSGVEEGTSSYADSPTVVTPTEISLSSYQKIYFQVFHGGKLL